MFFSIKAITRKTHFFYRFIILIPSILIFCNPLRGQDVSFISASWITFTGDTITGKILEKINTQGQIEAIVSDSVLFYLSPENISSIIIDNELIYKSFPVFSEGQKKNYFIKKYLSGKASLYIGKFRKNETVYLIENDQRISMIERSRPEFSLKALLGDCPGLSYDRITYNKNFFGDLIRRYNSCKNSKTREINTVEKQLEFLVGINFKFHTGRVSFPEFSYYGWGEDFEPFNTFGIGINSSIFLSDKSIIYSELNYLATGGYSEYINTTPVTEENISSEVTIKNKYLNLPILFKYRLFDKIIAPFIAAGVDLNFLLNGTLEEIPYELSTDYTRTPKVEYAFFEFGITGQIGIDYNISRDKFLSIFIGYSNTNNDMIINFYSATAGLRRGGINMNSSRFQFSISYNFNIL